MTDRREGTICLVHLVPFVDCPCEERRNTTDAPLQVLMCVLCKMHVSECPCPQPELEIRGAA